MAAVLAYLGGWVSGLIVWFVEADRPAVRLHAMQSILTFGTACLAWATLWIGSFAALIVSGAAFHIMQTLAQFVLLASVVVWLVCLWQAARGGTFLLPVAGPLAERITSRARDTAGGPPVA
ncbi:MAG TPA: hypothetical protein VF198_12495 [Vicinamibacterales bacterium]